MRLSGPTAAADDRRRASGAPRALGDLVALHALGWLVLGSAVGLLLATLLLAPGLGELLAPWTYGRWMPLHTDFLLYGWLALPLLGALLRAYLPAGGGWRAELALAVWSGALLAGGASWLAGRTSGKPFLEWSGAARGAWAAGLLLLALLLADGWRARRRAVRDTRGSERARGALLLALLAVGPTLWLVSDPATYPPIDPASGGPTGTSLLGSTVGLLAILLAVPPLAGVARRSGEGPRRTVMQTLVALALTAALFVALPSGDRGNDEPAQVLALVALLPWLVLLPRYAGAFAWPSAARRWLLALAAWGGLLLPSAIAVFLPELLRRWKFTNLLVAHAHLAMAGLCSALAALLLVALAESEPLRRALAAPAPFWAWQLGNAAMVLVLAALGVAEGGGLAGRSASAGPFLLFRPDEPWVDAAYSLRWVAGAAMLAAALRWLWGAAAAVRARSMAGAEVAASEEQARAAA